MNSRKVLKARKNAKESPVAVSLKKLYQTNVFGVSDKKRSIFEPIVLLSK